MTIKATEPCSDWRKLEKDDAYDRIFAMVSVVFSKKLPEQRALAAATVAAFSRQEWGADHPLMQYTPTEPKGAASPLPELGGKCPTPRRIPVLFDDYTNGGNAATGCLNPNVRFAKSFAYATKIGALIDSGNCVKRAEALKPNGLSNHVLEYALANEDYRMVRMFSVSYLAHFLGAGYRMQPSMTDKLKTPVPGIPKAYFNIKEFRRWYVAACQDVNAHDEIMPWSEAASFAALPKGSVYDDELMIKTIDQSHTSSRSGAEMYWSQMKGLTTKLYEKWKSRV